MFPGMEVVPASERKDGSFLPVFRRTPGKHDDQEKEYAGDFSEPYDPAEDDR